MARSHSLPLRRGHDGAASLALSDTRIGNDAINVVIHRLCKRFLDPANLSDYLVVRFVLDHFSHCYYAPSNSSGVQRMGISYPQSATTRDSSLIIAALAMCRQFQVNRKSTPWTHETAM